MKTNQEFLPMSITPSFDAIPQILKDTPRWILWKLIPAEPKPKKVPMTPKSGKLVNASVTDPENWLAFNEAISWYNRGACTGLGFVLTDAAPKVCCVDVDNCFDTDGSLTAEAQTIIAACQNSFAEKSQSGGGIHCWFIDNEFSGGRRKGNVEVYGADRYIAMTGCRIDPTAKDLLTIDGACNAIVAKFIDKGAGNLFEAKSARSAEEKFSVDVSAESDLPMTDNDRRLIDYFRSDKCKAQDVNMFNLFSGNSAEYFKSKGELFDDSVADCHLMLKLLWYTGGCDCAGGDSARVQRVLHIFNHSGLAKRDKWQSRDDYRQRTLEAAFKIWVDGGRKARNPESTDARADSKDSTLAALKTELRAVSTALADFEAEKHAAFEALRAVEKFDNDTVFSDEIIKAAAFAKNYDPKLYSAFARNVKQYGDKHKDVKADMNSWKGSVKDKALELDARRCDLASQSNEIQAEINSCSFAASCDFLKGYIIPIGYSVTAEHGVEKVEGEKIIPVCNTPVVICGKTFSVDENISKLTLAFQSATGSWKELPPTEKAIIANKNKIVDLANADLPVTTSNATHLVDYLYAFNALNEKSLPMTRSVPRCGWYPFSGRDYFVDPRRDCVITDGAENIRVKVDEARSDFATHLTQHGRLDVWKKAYQLARPSPVARLTVAAACAPILLKILGSRNFLLYIYAPTRAGKTTALYLAASAIGTEKIIRSFDATKNGLAGAAADVNDYAFLIDEKQVADNRLKEQFDNLVYALANGLGRTKLNKDSTLKKMHDWRTIAIMTGETPLLSDTVTGGAYSRLLTIKAPKEILSTKDCKFIRDTARDNYGLALPLVIDKVLEFGRERLREVYDAVESTFIKAFSDLSEEYCRYMAVLTLADTLLNTALFGNTVTTAAGETIQAIDDATLCFKKIFKLIPTKAEIDDTPREKDFVLSFISQNQNRFLGVTETQKLNDVLGSLHNDDGFSYIAAEALRGACAKAGFDYRKLVNDLVDDGFFKPADTIEKGRKTPLATVQKQIGRSYTRCYRIWNSEIGKGK